MKLKTRLSGKRRLAVVGSALTLGALSFAAIALADNVQINDLATGSDATKAPGDTGTATVRMVANSAPTGDIGGCNVDASHPATVTVSSSQAWLTIDSPGTVSFTACGNGGAQQIGYSVAPGAPDGGVATIATSTSGGKAGAEYNEDSFNVTVSAPTPTDTTDPTIQIVTPEDGATYLLNQSVLADYSCADEAGGSGLASCVGDVASGSAIDTSTVGSHSFTVNAADNAGNTASQTNHYAVVYDFHGFFSPVDNLPTLNVAKAGSSIPVKFSLAGNQGLNILAAGSPSSKATACDAPAGTDAAETTVTAGNSSLSYDATADQYVYVWKTDKAWAGTCRQLQVKLADGTTHAANFKLTK